MQTILIIIMIIMTFQDIKTLEFPSLTLFFASHSSQRH